MHSNSLLESCPLVAVGEFVYKLRPVKESRRGDNGGWYQVEVLKPVGVPLLKCTFMNNKLASELVELCNTACKDMSIDLLTGVVTYE